MSALNILQLSLGPLIAAVVSYYIFVLLASRERKRDRALSLNTATNRCWQELH